MQFLQHDMHAWYAAWYAAWHAAWHACMAYSLCNIFRYFPVLFVHLLLCISVSRSVYSCIWVWSLEEGLGLLHLGLILHLCIWSLSLSLSVVVPLFLCGCGPSLSDSPCFSGGVVVLTVGYALCTRSHLYLRDSLGMCTLTTWPSSFRIAGVDWLSASNWLPLVEGCLPFCGAMATVAGILQTYMHERCMANCIWCAERCRRHIITILINSTTKVSLDYIYNDGQF